MAHPASVSFLPRTTLRGLGALAGVLAAVTVTAPAAAPRDDVSGQWARGVAQIESGPIAGVVSDGIRVFKGVPYAAPPVGERRWRGPEPAPSWPTARSATQWGPACPQSLPELLTEPIGETSEDCLSLNVWSPAASPSDRRAVMVWFHGGAYLQGASSQRFYDGTALAKRGVVVVTFNYRLGPFGFFAHPALSRESGRDASGNQGLADAIAALQWIRRNAHAFGGDPGRVTVFGQSSGAGLINALMTAPAAAGTFHRAILQSGTVLGPMQWLREERYGLASGEAIGMRLQRRLGVGDDEHVLGRLRARSTADVLEAADPQRPFTLAGNRYAPIVDGHLLPVEPVVALEQGRAARVPVLVGANEDEGTVFVPLFGPTPAFAYAQLAAFAYGARAEQVLRLFPATSESDARPALARSLGVAAFVAPARRLAALLARQGVPAFLYHFTKRRPGEVAERLGAFHGAELPYVFGTLADRDVPGFGRIGVDDTDRSLADTIQRYWVRFAETGDPNGPGLPPWPRFDAGTKRALELGASVTARDHVHDEASDVFDAVYADWRARR